MLVFSFAHDADAKGPYMNNFNSTYGTDSTRLDTCGLCHYDFGGGGLKNPYGEAFGANGHNFGPLEGVDSDGDGSLSSEEIAALTMPGLTCDNLGQTSGAPADVADYVDPSNPGCGGGPVDNDSDGYDDTVDCDDNDPAVNPGAAEECTDGIDNDCDTLIDTDDPDAVNCPLADNDSDGYTSDVDCDDNDPAINPGAVEDCNDGIDNDCDNLIDTADPDAVGCLVCTDGDTDGYAVEGSSCGPIDCDDTAPAVNPGAIEDCVNGVDDDCDTLIDGADSDCITTSCADITSKSVCNNDLNCEWVGNPRNGSCQDIVSCTITEDPEVSCSDGIDNDCDGDTDSSDADCGGGTTEPEICDDGIDNDGDGKTDCADKKDCNKDPVC